MVVQVLLAVQALFLLAPLPATGHVSATTRLSCDPSADSTRLLMAAFNRSHSRVTLAGGRTCVAEPLALVGVQNLTIFLEQGAELQAKRGSQLFGTLLSLDSVTDVTIQGLPAASGSPISAYPADVGDPVDPYAPTAAELTRPALRMWRSDYANASLYAHSEHRHALSLHHCSSITLRSLRLAYSGGDGIYVESVTGGLFTDLTIDHNFRQGMSVIEAHGLVVSDTVFASTRGTAPMAGIDFEPNSPHNSIDGVQISSCKILRNAGAGVQFSLHALTKDTNPLGVNFTDTLIVSPLSICLPGAPGCYTKKPYYRWGILVEAGGPTLPAGVINFNSTAVIDTGHWSSPPVWVEKPYSPQYAALHAKFSNLTIHMIKGGPAVTISAVAPTSGGVTIDGVVVDRQCCPGGGAFLSAQDSGENKVISVSVSDAQVLVNSTDDAATAAAECNATVSADAANNGVAVSPVTCVQAPGRRT